MVEGKPVILAVDDEPAVLSAVARDLRRQYGDRYRIVRASSGESALLVLEELDARGDLVALMLSDQRMSPGMGGVEFLSKAARIVPEARRVLLTAYADTEAAIQAINQAHLQHYLMKPWDPPEERLYPVVDDQLQYWEASLIQRYSGLRVVGHRWSAAAHTLRDYLARNLVPYRWLDVEEDGEAAELLERAGADGPLPVIFFEDGTWLAQPAIADLAAKLGRSTQAAAEYYDLVIVGGGPAGLASAVYGASEGLRTLLIEAEAPGGQAGTSSAIENYLGFPAGLSGSDLTQRAVAQARRFGAEILTPLHVCNLHLQDPYRILHLTNGSQVSCGAMVIASGVQYRTLDGVPGIEELTGAGVFYGAAITEALSCRDRDVYIVGGGNSAGQAAMYLSRFARSVHILIRGAALAASMSHYLIQRIEEAPNIEVRPYTRVAGAEGEGRLEALRLIEGDVERTVPADALFIFIGAMPRTEWAAEVVLRDDYGFILTGTDTMKAGRPPTWTVAREPFWLETSVPGVFAAGDVRHRSVKRVASAVGEGSMAVQFIHQHLASL